MKNTAQVWNDGVSVYFNSYIKLDWAQKLVLFLVNFIVVGFFSFIAFILLSDSPTKGTVFLSLIVFPGFYVLTLGRYTLWNLRGSEHIVVNMKGIIVTRRYGPIQMPLRIIEYRNLYYKVISHNQNAKAPIGTILFTDHNSMDLPVVIFSSAINVPVSALEELINNLEVIFAIEQLDKATGSFVHLN